MCLKKYLKPPPSRDVFHRKKPSETSSFELLCLIEMQKHVSTSPGKRKRLCLYIPFKRQSFLKSSLIIIQE